MAISNNVPPLLLLVMFQLGSNWVPLYAHQGHGFAWYLAKKKGPACSNSSSLSFFSHSTNPLLEGRVNFHSFFSLGFFLITCFCWGGGVLSFPHHVVLLIHGSQAPGFFGLCLIFILSWVFLFCFCGVGMECIGKWEEGGMGECNDGFEEIKDSGNKLGFHVCVNC